MNKLRKSFIKSFYGSFLKQKFYNVVKETARRLNFMGAIFETVMLVCFGLSWPINVVKAYKTKTTKGTSLPFIFLIIAGYVAGIVAKIITGQMNYVLIVYAINLLIVMMNVVVYARNYQIDKRNHII